MYPFFDPTLCTIVYLAFNNILNERTSCSSDKRPWIWTALDSLFKSGDSGTYVKTSGQYDMF